VLERGPARRVAIYINEDSRRRSAPLYQAVLQYLAHRGVTGAAASKAIAGFGWRRRLHTASIEVPAEHLPVRIEFVENPSKVDEVATARRAMSPALARLPSASSTRTRRLRAWRRSWKACWIGQS